MNSSKVEPNLTLLAAIALRRYIHCQKKLYRGVELTETEVEDFYSSSMLQSMWVLLEPEVMKALKLGGYTSIDTDIRRGLVKISMTNRALYYPFILARHPPPISVLEELAKAADDYRLFDDSLICLSGSAPLGGVVDTIGDLDLFEYVQDINVTNALRMQKPKYGSGKIVCLKTKIAKIKDHWPSEFNHVTNSDMIHHTKIRRYSAKYLNNYNFCKIDMVGQFGQLWGEVTNIIYKSDSSDANCDSPTHTFQEITVDKPPLDNAGSLKNFGKYCFFLRDEIEKIGLDLARADQHPDTRHATNKEMNFKAVKGAKRAINLCSILNINYDEFANIANSYTGKRFVATQLLSLVSSMVADNTNSSDIMQAENSLNQIMKDLKEENNDGFIFDIHHISKLLLDLVQKMDALCLPIDLEGGVDQHEIQKA